MENSKAIERAEKLILFGNEIEKTQWKRQVGRSTYIYVDNGKMAAFRSSCLSFIKLFYGTSHPHFIEFENSTKNHYLGNLAAGVGIMIAIKEEIAEGWLTTYKGLVSSEIFSNFIEMSEHLLEQGYKDPAAVVLGSVLEEHLRQLCLKFKVDIKIEVNGKFVPKKADTLNANLVKAGAYNVLDQKSVTSWLDLRNKAAHGNYIEYSQEQVKLMLQGVLEFISRNNI
jgi:hypothetical protein